MVIYLKVSVVARLISCVKLIWNWSSLGFIKEAAAAPSIFKGWAVRSSLLLCVVFFFCFTVIPSLIGISWKHFTEGWIQVFWNMWAVSRKGNNNNDEDVNRDEWEDVNYLSLCLHLHPAVMFVVCTSVCLLTACVSGCRPVCIQQRMNA